MEANILTKTLQEQSKITNSYEMYSMVRATYDRLIVVILQCIKNAINLVNKEDATTFYTHTINEIAYLYAKDQLTENADYSFINEINDFEPQSRKIVMDFCMVYERLPDPHSITNEFMLEFYIYKILADLYIFWQNCKSMASTHLPLLKDRVEISLKKNYFTFYDTVTAQMKDLSTSDKIAYMNQFRTLHTECENYLNSIDNSSTSFLVKLEANKSKL